MVLRIVGSFVGFLAVRVKVQNGNATLIAQEIPKHEPRMDLTPDSISREYSLEGKDKMRLFFLEVVISHEMLTFHIAYSIFLWQFRSFK